jgi:hypothetical protein
VYYGISTTTENRAMDPDKTASHPAVEGLTEEEILGEESLNEIEVEDLLGHHVELDEQDEDWRATMGF